MVYSEAIALVTPLLTKKTAQAYVALQSDQMLWVEENIMDPAGVYASINSTFGELVCEHIEVALDAIAAA